MPVIVVAPAGARWGLNAESGIVVQHSEWETSIEENPSKNRDGEFQMTSFYNPTQSINISGISLATGLANVLVGFAFSVANSFSNNGVSSGSVYATRVRQVLENVGFCAASITAVRRPLI